MQRFVAAALKVATAQLVRGVGYDRASTAALDTLTDVLSKCLLLPHLKHTHTRALSNHATRTDVEEVGARAHEYCELAGRTEANAIDVLAALAGMHAGDEAALMQFLDATDTIAFPKPLRPPPDAERRQLDIIREQAAAVTPARWDRPPPPYVPAFLPPFPKQHTYAATPPAKTEPPRPEVLTRRAKQQRSSETSLVHLVRDTQGRQFQDYAAAVGVAAAAPARAAQKKRRQKVKPPEPTPPKDVGQEHYYSRTLSGEESSGEERQQQLQQGYLLQDATLIPSTSPVAAGGVIEDTERARKRIKCDQILSLTHKDGMEESLFEPTGAAASASAAASAPIEDIPPGVPQQEDGGYYFEDDAMGGMDEDSGPESPPPPTAGLFQ